MAWASAGASATSRTRNVFRFQLEEVRIHIAADEPRMLE